MEVGVGGRFDATNVFARPVACCINTLDYDHTAILGDTIDLIAWEKTGIIKKQCVCFLAPQAKGGTQVVIGKPSYTCRLKKRFPPASEAGYGVCNLLLV